MSERKGLGDNIWVLIPLAALTIPILAVSGGSESPLTWSVGVLVIVVAVTLAVRSLMTHRHNLRLKEIEAQERASRAEREHLSAAQRILDLDDGVADLGDALRDRNDPQPG